MSALAEVHDLRRRRARAAGSEVVRPIGARPVQWVAGRPQVEPPELGRIRADVWWSEVRRREAAGTLDNRTLAHAHFASLMSETDPAKLREACIQAGAFVTELADALARPGVVPEAPSVPPVPAQR